MKKIKLPKWLYTIFCVRRSYSFDDMKWAFEQGIHEGKLRQLYGGKEDEFSESELEYYLQHKH